MKYHYLILNIKEIIDAINGIKSSRFWALLFVAFSLSVIYLLPSLLNAAYPFSR